MYSAIQLALSMFMKAWRVKPLGICVELLNDFELRSDFNTFNKNSSLIESF